MGKASEQSLATPTPRPRAALTLINAQREQSFDAYDCFVGVSPHIAALKEFIGAQSAHSKPVLLIGEPGLRQEQVARALHQSGPHWAQPFFSVNAHSLSGEALHALLFGQPGQHQSSMIETCGRGTIYINDLTHLSPLLQQRFAVQIEGQMWRTQAGDARAPRLVFSTEWNPAEMKAENRIGYSLVELLRATSFTLKPLRERSEDIPYLVHHLVARLVKKLNKGEHEIDPAALRMMTDHDWPGNIDELEAVLEGAIQATGPHRIDETLLPARVRYSSLKSIPTSGIDLAQMVDDFERNLIDIALRQTGNNQTKASSLLGLRVQTLNMKLKRFREQGEKQD